MFYKEHEGQWLAVNEVHFFDDTKLNDQNRSELDGWKYHDEPPAEYVEYLKTLDNGFEQA